MARGDVTRKKIAGMSPAERVSLAEKKASELWRFIGSLAQTHGNNQIVNATNRLSSQIGRSYAGHAFFDFQQAILYMELAKLTALWDRPDLGKFSIPTVIALIDEPKVLRILYRRRLFERLELERVFRRNHREEFAFEELQQHCHVIRVGAIEAARRSYRKQLRIGMGVGRAVMESKRLLSIRDFRDRYIAHNLDADDPGIAARPYTAPKFGQERRLLMTTCRVTDALNGVIRGAGFQFESLLGDGKRNAGYLWDGCRFTAIR